MNNTIDTNTVIIEALAHYERGLKDSIKTDFDKMGLYYQASVNCSNDTWKRLTKLQTSTFFNGKKPFLTIHSFISSAILILLEFC